MKSAMAGGTQRDEVLFRIISGAAAEFNMVDLEISHRAAGLATPTIAPEHSPVKVLVGLWTEA